MIATRRSYGKGLAWPESLRQAYRDWRADGGTMYSFAGHIGTDAASIRGWIKGQPGQTRRSAWLKAHKLFGWSDEGLPLNIDGSRSGHVPADYPNARDIAMMDALMELGASKHERFVHERNSALVENLVERDARIRHHRERVGVLMVMSERLVRRFRRAGYLVWESEEFVGEVFAEFGDDPARIRSFIKRLEKQ